ncbi:Mbov_0401 family ICE element transposase-like protein [Spiroplasma endosymbiont of Sarcophaga carnaria]|uniref:Mbov_0401 family ICE element transposase-like protein n=1 Tax=Spiroplasma endosymbiont of Sarcophaga carnaria TaxID=3066303 RepID=UPI0030D1E6F9
MEEVKYKTALLIDYDNFNNEEDLKILLKELEMFGDIIMKKVFYSNFEDKKLSEKLKKLGLMPIIQLSYSTGKNATDIRMTIEAMDLVFLLDTEMGRKPYQRIHFDLYIKVLKELDSGKRYRDIIDKYKDSKISPMTISNIFRSVDLAEINENFKHMALPNKIRADSKYVYLGLDDTFTKIFKKHKKIDKNMVRLAYLHTGIDWQKSSKKRHFLQNKRLLMVMSKNVNLKMKEYRQLLKKFINNNYDLIGKQLIVMGDGAEWIKKLAEYLKTDYVLDEFHLMAKVHHCFNFRRLGKDSKKELTVEETQKKAIYQDVYAFVRKGEVNSILDYLKPFLTKEMQDIYPFLKDKKDKVKDLIQYITTNTEGIKNYQQEYYIGCQT